VVEVQVNNKKVPIAIKFLLFWLIGFIVGLIEFSDSKIITKIILVLLLFIVFVFFMLKWTKEENERKKI